MSHIIKRVPLANYLAASFALGFKFAYVVIKAPYFFVLNCYDAVLFCYLSLKVRYLERKLRDLTLQCARREKMLEPVEHGAIPNAGGNSTAKA